MTHHERRVVVTGMGVVSSLGYDPVEVFDRLCRGENGISTIRRFDVSEAPSRIGGIIEDFDPKRFVPERKGLRLLRLADLIQAMALVSAYRAMEDAGVSEHDVEPEQLGVFFGTGDGGHEALKNHVLAQLEISRGLGLNIDSAPDEISGLMERIVCEASRRVNPTDHLQRCPSLVSSYISMLFNAQGPVLTNVNLCSASAQAIGEAVWVIRRGDARMMITGGSDSMLSPGWLAGFCALDAVSGRNDPDTASRPFDRTRDGCVVAEGAVTLILEDLAHAEARGARVYAEILGYGSSSDAFKVSAPPEDGRGAVLSMTRALRDAGLDPAGVGHINAHGTSTPLNDRIETTAIKSVFGEAAYSIPTVSTKSMMGHMIAAAGAFEAFVSVMSLVERRIHPTRNLRKPDPLCDLDYAPEGCRSIPDLDCVLSNSFAIGGTNATLIFKAAPGGTSTGGGAR